MKHEKEGKNAIVHLSSANHKGNGPQSKPSCNAPFDGRQTNEFSQEIERHSLNSANISSTAEFEGSPGLISGYDPWKREPSQDRRVLHTIEGSKSRSHQELSPPRSMDAVDIIALI
jgi:hypothetical protein